MGIPQRKNFTPEQLKRLTPGQEPIAGFTPIGERAPSAEIANWRLEVTGLVRQPLQFTLDEFLSLPVQERVWDTICVTGWTHFDHRWQGVPLALLLERVQPLPNTHFVRFVAYSNHDHDTSLTLDYARQHVLLAHSVDNAPLTVAHGAPVRSVCEGKYFYKSVKWLRRIEVLETDQPGYWERSSAYHNNADPWREERYAPQPMEPAKFQECVQKRDFGGAFAIQDEQFKQLKDRNLAGANFAAAQIKNCNLSHYILRGANCQDANFTLTRLDQADLEGSNLTGCDLEGASLRGTNLRDADLRGTALTATRFALKAKPTILEGARFSRASIESEGVKPEVRAFILDPAQGAIIE